MMACYSATFFGGFEVHRDGELLAGFGYEKVKALFAYLAVENPVPLSREVIASVFWPEQPEEKARHSLRQAVSQLRAVLRYDEKEPAFILASRTSIQRNPQVCIRCDVSEIEGCLTASTSEGSDIAALERGVSLYRGELLKGLSLSGAEPFEEWLANRRAYYHRLVATSLEKIIDIHEHRSNFEQARIFAEKWVSLEPWREEAHRKLMLYYARCGQRSAALWQYQACRRELLDGLDISPDRETESLARRIQFQNHLQKSLPQQTSPIIGREPELERLEGYLSDSDTRLVTLTGQGGVGKTRLALEVGKRIYTQDRRLFLNGVVFVPLSGSTSLEGLLAGVAQSLGLSLARDVDQKKALLHQLKDLELLLILDNFEQLIEPAVLSFVSKVLSETRLVKILVTSRHRLHLSGEVLVPLAGLSYPKTTSTAMQYSDSLESTYEAVEFFLTRMARSGARLTLSELETSALVRLCQLVEGLPLGLELASVWIDMLSIPEITREVERSLDFLQAEYADLPDRHRSMRVAMEVSWTLLNEEEKLAFSALSVFRGGFTWKAAKAVAGADRRILSSLVNKSILRYDDQQQRCSLHELLLQFAAGKLAEDDPRRTEILDRHCTYFSSFARFHDPILSGQIDEDNLDDLEWELGNLGAAWSWACDKKWAAGISGLAGCLHQLFSRRGIYQEGVRYFQMGLDSFPDQYSPDDPLAYARLTAFAGDLSAQAGYWESGRKLLLRSLEHTSSHQQLGEETESLKAFVFSRLGAFTQDSTSAGDFLLQSLQLYQGLKDSRQAARVLVDLGNLTRVSGNLEQARSYLEESLRIQEETGLSLEKIHTLTVLGLYALRTGELADSVPHLEEAVRLARTVKDRDRLAEALEARGMACLYLGSFQQAEAFFHQSLEIRSELGQLAYISAVPPFIAYAQLHQGLWKQAAAEVLPAYSLARELGYPASAATALVVHGASALAEGDYDQARHDLAESVAAYRTGWQQDWQARRGMALAYLSCVDCLEDKLEQAKMHLVHSLQLSVELHSYFGVVHGLAAGSLFLIKTGRMDWAEKIYSLAKTQPLVKYSALFNELIGRYIPARSDQPVSRAAVGDQRSTIQELWEAAQALLSGAD
jgi:DNA-binding SARP family transcriptional activator/predicted ATPase